LSKLQGCAGRTVRLALNYGPNGSLIVLVLIVLIRFPERKSGEAVFSGSIIRQGEANALVYATGANTYFGETAQLVQTAHTVSHFQKAVLKIGNYLIILAVVWWR